MIAREIADQFTETAYVIEQLLIDAAFGSAVGFSKRFFGAGRVAGSEAGKRELA